MAPFKTELDAYLAFLKQIDLDFVAGATIKGICEKYDISSEQFDSLIDRVALAENSPESLTQSAMIGVVVPLFRSKKDTSEVDQIASGVLLRISSQSFLLTAAHVTDELDTGYLLVPGENGLIGVGGYVSYWKPSEGESRKSDKIDIAYLRLGRNVRARIHSSFRDVTLNEISYQDTVAPIPFATFVGYPVTKAKRRSGARMSEIVTYTGHLWSKDVYDKLGFSQERHICVRMRLKEVYSSRHRRKLMAPFPAGISGGAIIAWPMKFSDRRNNPSLRLVGIAHSFNRTASCLTGTHIKMFIRAILHNHPKLRPAVQRALDRAARLLKV